MDGKCFRRLFAVSVVFSFLMLSFSLTLFGEEGKFSYVELGDAAFEKGNFDEAIEHYTKRLDEMAGESGRAIVLSKRGRAYLSLMRHEDALSDFDRAVALAPGYKDAYYNRAVAHLEMGRYGDAKRDGESALKIDSSVSEYYILMGTLKNIDGDYKGALNDFDTAVKLVRESPEAYLGRGSAFYGLKQYNFAQRDFNRAIKLNPDFAPAYRGVAMVYLKTDEDGDGGLALGFAERAVKLNRSHQNLDTLAAALYRGGMIEGAVKVEEEAIERLKEEGAPGEQIRFGTAYKERLELYGGGSAVGGD